MLNTKFIKIIIAIVIVLVLIFTFIFIKNNNIGVGSENTNSTSTLTGSNGRPVLNTNLGNNPDTSTSSNSIGEVDEYTNVDPNDYNNTNPESVLKKKIEKILSNWSITKDPNLLREALVLSEGLDNEVVFEAWVPFMKTDSSELVKLITTSTNTQKTKATIRGIFEWYIELSGEYEKLTIGKKQQVTNQYNQLK
jgi:hypothetical protein